MKFWVIVQVYISEVAFTNQRTGFFVYIKIPLSFSALRSAL